MVLTNGLTQVSNYFVPDMDPQAINAIKTHMQTLLNKNEENLQEVMAKMQEMKQQLSIQKTRLE